MIDMHKQLTTARVNAWVNTSVVVRASEAGVVAMTILWSIISNARP